MSETMESQDWKDITEEKYIYAKDALIEIRKALYKFEQSTEKELFEDKEAFESWVENDRPYFQAGGELAQQAIFLTPKADVVEVVRCKDCKWFRVDNKELWCGHTDGLHIEELAFCSDGKRRDDAENHLQGST